MVNVPPVSGFIPDGIGDSQRFKVTGCVARASGIPPGPTGQPPAAPVPVVPAVVPLPQAARNPEMLESETAAPPARTSTSRRVYPRGSLGCNVIGPSLVATVVHQREVRPSSMLVAAVARTRSARQRPRALRQPRSP